MGKQLTRMQQLSIGEGCDKIATVQHEFLHALGFWHEQSRSDRDDYVSIIWDRIISGTFILLFYIVLNLNTEFLNMCFLLPLVLSINNGKTLMFWSNFIWLWASQVALVVKNLPANAGDARDTDLIPGLERSPGEGMATHSSILAWSIPWTRSLTGYSL